MRLFLLFFFIFSLLSLVKSQTPTNLLSPEDPGFNQSYLRRPVPKVNGKLIHVSEEELNKLSISYTLVTPLAVFQVKKTAQINPDGSFSLILDYALPYQQIWFSVGELFYAGLYANKGLYVELDMKKLNKAKKVQFNGNGVRYLGPDGPLNEYLNNYTLYQWTEEKKLSDDTILTRASDSAISSISKINTSVDPGLRIQQNYIATNPSPYSWILENERLSDYYQQIIQNYWGKKMDDSLWQKIKQHKSYLISNDGTLFYKYLIYYVTALPDNFVSPTWKDVAADPGLNIAEKLAIDSLKNSETMEPVAPYTAENINKWTGQLKTRIQKAAFNRALNRNIRKLDSVFPASKADFLKLGLSLTTDLNEQIPLLDHVARSMHTPWCIKVLRNEYLNNVRKVNEINTALARSTGGNQHSMLGKPLFETSFGAVMYKAPGIKALDFLVKLKQAFPGKSIIIDRWATWCVPCLAAMPHSKQLHQESKNLPVVFVYLCTTHNSSESKWKSKVMEIKQPGYHFLIDEAMDTEISNYFSFSGYPGYAFIDSTGKYQPNALKNILEIANADALSALIKKY
jgi:thiol-disulfide isomerase/thioredoxin